MAKDEYKYDAVNELAKFVKYLKLEFGSLPQMNSEHMVETDMSKNMETLLINCKKLFPEHKKQFSKPDVEYVLELYRYLKNHVKGTNVISKNKNVNELIMYITSGHYYSSILNLNERINQKLDLDGSNIENNVKFLQNYKKKYDTCFKTAYAHYSLHVDENSVIGKKCIELLHGCNRYCISTCIGVWASMISKTRNPKSKIEDNIAIATIHNAIATIHNAIFITLYRIGLIMSTYMINVEDKLGNTVQRENFKTVFQDKDTISLQELFTEFHNKFNKAKKNIDQMGKLIGKISFIEKNK
jgi:hypothetical protein